MKRTATLFAGRATTRVLPLVLALTLAPALPFAPCGSSVARADARGEAHGPDALAGVRACIGERDDAKRLACFDRAAAALPAEAALAGAPAAPPPPKMTPEERFGYRGQVAREEIEKRKAEDTALDELRAKIVRVSAQGSGDFVVTLDNGQVWAQIPMGKPERVKVDEPVTIKRASFGSFMLSAPHARGVRVRRVK